MFTIWQDSSVFEFHHALSLQDSGVGVEGYHARSITAASQRSRELCYDRRLSYACSCSHPIAFIALSLHLSPHRRDYCPAAPSIALVTVPHDQFKRAHNLVEVFAC